MLIFIERAKFVKVINQLVERVLREETSQERMAVANMSYLWRATIPIISVDIVIMHIEASK